MTYLLSRLFLSLALAVLVEGATPDLLVGTWTLSSQMVNEKKVEYEPLTLRIYPAGDALEFAYSMPVNGIHLVSMKFIGVHLDGREAAVQDVRGNKIGTVHITKVGPAEYKAVIEGPNRPKAVAKMTVSADQRTLTSESGAPGSNGTSPHAVQTFTRH